MLPNFSPGPIPIFGIEIHLFGILVGLAIIVGTIVAGRRARQLGLSERVVADVAIWAVVVGFVIAHLYSAIFYFPEKVAENPLYLLEFWNGISSIGGFIGGAMGVGLYFWRKKDLPFLPYADAIIYGFAFAWIFGRLGCTFAFDHPGSLAEGFFLAEYYPGSSEVSAGYRHNLGMYEAFWAMGMAAFFYSQRNKARFKGWYLAMFIIWYTPFRFSMDFLRAEDERYAGLTPAQWGLIGLGGLCVWLFVRGKQRADLLAPDGEPKYWPKGELEAYERAQAVHRGGGGGKGKGRKAKAR